MRSASLEDEILADCCSRPPLPSLCYDGPLLGRSPLEWQELSPGLYLLFLAMLWAKCSLSHTGLQLFLWFEPKSVDVIWEGHSSTCCRDGQEAWMWSIMGGVPEEAASWRRRKRRRAGRGHHCLLGATWAAAQGCPTGQNHGGSRSFSSQP